MKYRHLLMSFGGLASVSFAPSMAAAQAAPQVATTRLGAPEAEFPHALITVMGVRELSDGGVLIVDSRRNAVFRGDLQAGTIAQVGSLGRAPEQYCHPTHLIPLPGDTTWVYDAAGRRLVVLAPPGWAGAPFNPAIADTVLRKSFLAGIAAGATDTTGSLYVRGAGSRAVARLQAVNFDSVAIERWNRALSRVDTVAMLPPAGRPGPSPSISKVPPLRPFASTDQWAVSRDGHVAIAHLDPYRVDIVSRSGERINGKPLPVTLVPVGEAERAQWQRERPYSGDGGVPLIRRINGRVADDPCGTLPRISERDLAWPDALPAFPPDAMHFAPDGLLWVQRNVAAGQPDRFDIVDRAAKVVAQVVLPPDTHLVGFGARSLYAVRVDETHAQFLQRYPLPRLTSSSTTP